MVQSNEQFMINIIMIVGNEATAELTNVRGYMQGCLIKTVSTWLQVRKFHNMCHHKKKHNNIILDVEDSMKT